MGLRRHHPNCSDNLNMDGAVEAWEGLNGGSGKIKSIVGRGMSWWNGNQKGETFALKGRP